MFDGLLEGWSDARARSAVGQHLVALEFAFEKHAVEVEDDCIEAHSILEQRRADPHRSCAEHDRLFEIARHSHA